MDEDVKKSILKTGTTTLGIVCKDGIVVAADRRVTFGTSDNQGVSYIAGEHPKIVEVSPNAIVTTAGQSSDTKRIVRVAQAELKLKELKSHSKPTLRQMANLFASMLYQGIRQPSMIPSIAHFLLAGYDEEGIHLYNLMPDGFLEKVNTYVASGSGMMQVNPVLDSDYKKDLTIQEGIDLAKKCLSASFGRDPASGAGRDIYVVTKEGIKKVVSEEIQPSFKED